MVEERGKGKEIEASGTNEGVILIAQAGSYAGRTSSSSPLPFFVILKNPSEPSQYYPVPTISTIFMHALIYVR